MTAVVTLEGVAALGAMSELRAGFVRALQKVHDRHGPLVSVRYPRHRRLDGGRLTLVADPAIARAVLMDPACFTSPGVYPRLGAPGSPHRRLRQGIILAKGEDHAEQRRRVLQCLAPAAVEALRPRITEICREEAASWPCGRVVDLAPLIKRLLRRVSLELLFGEADLALGLDVARVLEPHAELSLSLQAVLLPFDLPGFDYHRLMRRAERAEAVLSRWIAERRRRPVLGADMLSRLVADCDGEPEGAVGQLWTLYGASFHTMTAALGWLLALLAQHPEEAGRLRASLADPDRCGGATPAAEDAILEAMRLLTPVPFQVRQAARAAVLPGAELQLEERDTLVLSALVMNRSAALFGPDPLAFRPGRWAAASAAARNDPLIFSSGPRACPGRAFSFAVLGAALAGTWELWRIRLSPGERLDHRTAITMSAKHIRVTLEPQDGAFRSTRARGSAIRVGEALAGPGR